MAPCYGPPHDICVTVYFYYYYYHHYCHYSYDIEAPSHAYISLFGLIYTGILLDKAKEGHINLQWGGP